MSQRLPKTTLEHVALKAQVSISTVSRVLNGKAGVNEGTRRRVLAVLSSSSYPKTNTGNGHEQSSRTLGVLVPVAAQHWGLQSNLIQEGMRAVNDVGRQAGYVTLAGVFDPALRDRTEDRMIRNRQFAGVVLFRTRNEMEESRVFREHGIPCIIVNRLLPDLPLHYIGVDHAEVSRKAAAYLLESGYRRVGILLGDTNYVSHRLYLEGFQLAHRNAGVAIDASLTETIELGAEEGYTATSRLMKRRKRPDALVVPSDRSAIGALKALRDLGARVPDDIGMVALDSTTGAVFSDPPLTAVEIPWYEMLALGTSLLVKVIEDRCPVEQIGVRFASQLVLRDSTRRR
jgi:DNA-binding LacI/PurR family transcriptional regulator